VSSRNEGNVVQGNLFPASRKRTKSQQRVCRGKKLILFPRSKEKGGRERKSKGRVRIARVEPGERRGFEPKITAPRAAKGGGGGGTELLLGKEGYGEEDGLQEKG